MALVRGEGVWQRAAETAPKVAAVRVGTKGGARSPRWPFLAYREYKPSVKTLETGALLEPGFLLGKHLKQLVLIPLEGASYLAEMVAVDCECHGDPELLRMLQQGTGAEAPEGAPTAVRDAQHPERTPHRTDVSPRHGWTRPARPVVA